MQAGWGWLRTSLTVDELRRLLPETSGVVISRFELDAQARALGEWLRSRRASVPLSLVRQEPA